MTQQQQLESEISRNPSIRRLQHMLDVVLKHEYEDLVVRRDAVFNKVSQQVQFQKLIEVDLGLTSFAGQQQPKEVLHDLGCKVYARAQLLDPRGVIHMNVGCGVIVAMTIAEALEHSKKAEALHRKRADELTKRALHAKYKQRLVMEAIMRLQDIDISRATRKTRD
jgi:prefoldin subunit 5